MSGWLVESGVLEKWTAAAALEGGQVKGAEFVEASKAIISIFDLISGMSIPKGDMEGNATTLGKNLAAGQTIEAAIEAELAAGDKKKLIADGKTSTCAALWLARALYFIKGLMVALIEDGSKSLKDCVLAGYETSLKPHHGFMTKNVFAVRAPPARSTTSLRLTSPGRRSFHAVVSPGNSRSHASQPTHQPRCAQVAVKAAPYRKDFIAKIDPALSDEQVTELHSTSLPC